MGMKKTLPAAMLLTLGGYMTPASAITMVLGDLTLHPAAFGNTFGAWGYPTSFSDEYVFDLSSASQAFGTTLTFNLQAGPLDYRLGNMEIKLTDASGTTVYAMDSTPNSVGPLQILQISASLGAGNGYRLWVAGDVSGASGGAYGGVLTALPVPEADTYAMLLAGLGLIGYLTRRRFKPGAFD